MNLSFVVAVNSPEVLQRNLLASPCLASGKHELVLQEGFNSAAKAYNHGLAQCSNELVVFVHQDVFLPEGWDAVVESSIRTIEAADPNWGVAGCWGIADDQSKFGHLYTPGEKIIGRPMDQPERVRTLDEVVLIVRKSSRLAFDEQLPAFHFYGADICLAAKSKGMNCYAISAFCVHNSQQYFEYPKDFSDSYRIFKRKWARQLPIQTSCICVSRFDWDLQKRAVKRVMLRINRRHRQRGPRLPDPRVILDQT